MSDAVRLRELDRGEKGKCIATLHRSPKPHVRFQHLHADGALGGVASFLIDEIPIVLEVLRNAQNMVGSARVPSHRTVRAEPQTRAQVELQLEEDAKLF